MDGGVQPGSQMNMAYWSDDVEATYQTLKSRGVEFIAAPKKESWGTSAIFKDTEGNIFVLSSR
jgi:predicted enzyme related to lactoylglutathione lyase